MTSCHHMFASVAVCALLAGLSASPALAQRADDNAIADAEDAFGSNDGGEDFGLYGPFDVRGFSPIDAGNVRLEGVYVDRQADLSPRLVEGNRIRVGLSAAGYAFPAPSGIVDYRLRTPPDAPAASLVVHANSFGGAFVEADAALPLLPGVLSLGGGFSHSHSEYASANNAEISNLAIIGHWRPAVGTEFKPFWSHARVADEDIYPIILGDGLQPPPRIERRRFIGQHWADVETRRFNYGVLGRSELAGLSLRFGVLRSTTDVPEAHSIFLEAAAPGALAARSVSAIPGRRAASTSGEIAVAREFEFAGATHRVQGILRGREQMRRYGGGQRVALSPAPFGLPLFVDRPEFVFSTSTDDEVRQWSAGLTWQARTPAGQISAGVQRVGYRKTVGAPSGPRPPSEDEPWLVNVSAEWKLAPRLIGVVGYAQGLEESDVAPETAVNRDEAPPAIRTRQVDAALRWTIGKFALVGGFFDIERPYYGVDGAGVFRRLGDVRHRGIETSLLGSPAPGLTLVAGGRWIRARVSGDEVETGAIGDRPIDVPELRLIASLDWRPPDSDWSADLALEHLGANVGDALNRVEVRPWTTVDLGVRRRFTAGGASAVARLQVTNAFDAWGWEVAGSNAFVYVQPRQVSARLTVDF